MIGRIPLKRFVDPARPITYGIVQAGPDVPGGVRYIRPVDMDGHRGVPDPNSLRTTSREIAAAYRRSTVRRGEIVVSIGPSFGKTMLIEDERLVGANLTQGTARVAPAAGVDAGYLRWAFQSNEAVAHWEASVGGATFRALNLGPLAETPVPDRTLAEQRAIADFLDTETARIDALIAKKQRMRAALTERRVGLSRWLLSGRDVGGGRKTGPTPWLDSVPEGWDVVRVSRLFEVQLGRMLNQERATGEHPRPYLRNANVGWGRIDAGDVALMNFPPSERRRYRLRPGDLLVCEGGAGVAEAAVWRGGLSECYYQKSLHRVRPRTGLPVEWLAEWLRLWKSAGAHEAEGNLATIPHLTAEQLRAHRIPVPPIADARVRLAELERQAQHGRVMEEKLAAQVLLLQEHRQSLITAAVTGEFAVPGVAA